MAFISGRHSILERLKQLGYEPEISYFPPDYFRDSHKMAPNPLTDEGQLSPNEIALDWKLMVDTIEWARMLPKWLKTMNHFREERLDTVVYKPRRRSLASEYDVYMKHLSPDTHIFGLLPHVADLARFRPFRDIIKAPEGIPMDGKPFASAFAQLPMLAEEWRKQLDAELAELVDIPAHLSLHDASCRQVGAPRSITAEGKLHLACALFYINSHDLLPYPEIFFISTPRQGHYRDEDVSKHRSIGERLGIRSLKEAPYIIYACGLDPRVATSDNMDRRNARLICLVCEEGKRATVRDWRGAVCLYCSRG